MNTAIVLWQVLLVVGVGQKAAAGRVSVGNSNASLGRRQRGTQSWTPPSRSSSSQDTSTPENYWFKTGVVDEGRGFMLGRAETKKGGKVVGSYQYSDGHVKVKVVYTADQHGYRIIKEERVPMKSTTESNFPFKGSKVEPISRKPRPKPRVKLFSTKDESGDRNQQSPFAPDAPQGLQLGKFDLKLRTNHGSGGYSHQGLSLKPGKSRKHEVKNESNGLKIGKPRKLKPSVWQDEEDDYNDSLERPDEVRPKPIKVNYKSSKIPFKSAPNNKPKIRTPKLATEGLAIFFKNQYPNNGVPLFRPEEDSEPVTAPKTRNPRRSRRING